MNILITSQAAGVAGSTYSVSYLAKGLAKRNHRVWVACPEDTLLWSLVKESDVQPVPFAFPKKLHPSSIRELVALIESQEIDLINAQSSKDRYSTILAKWWSRHPVKLVHTRRQLVKSIGLFGQSTFYERGTDAIIAVSEGVKQSVRRIGISADHIKVIYNGTPAEKYENIQPLITASLRQKYGIGDDEVVIGCVARHKKQIQLLEALQYINEPVHVLFVGIESTPELISAQNRWATAHKIHFAGSVDNESVLHHYPLFTMKVLPSTIEGLSQALLESMALGIPVIATNIGGNSELIQDGVNGLLFENGDTKTLAKHIEQLIFNPDSRALFSLAGKKTALEDFSIERMLDRYEEFFESLLQS